MQITATTITKIAMVLVPDFNMLGATAFLDGFRAANYLAGQRIFDWSLIAYTGENVRASNGMMLTAQPLPSPANSDIYDIVGINASWTPEQHRDPALLAWLRHQARSGALIGGIDTGVFLLGYAGLFGKLATSINNKREVLEDMRDRMGALMEVRFGTVWHPPKGNHVSHQNKLTSAVVDARSYLHAKKQEKLTALMPAGTKIAFAGGKQFDNLDKIWKILDKAKARYPDMVLVHGDSPGAEHIAKKWAEASGVSQIRCTPEWKVYEKAAPFRRNDEMLKLDLIALIATPGSGVTENLVDKAKAKNVKVVRIS